MIRMILEHFDHTVELKLPAEYEHLLVSLWKLGLNRDPQKYTLGDLNAVFQYDTPEEHQMIRLIDANDTLMYAMVSLHEMLAPPVPFAAELRQKLRDGVYRTAEEYGQDMESLVYDTPSILTSFYFPVSGEVVGKNGTVRQADDEMLRSYHKMIEAAVTQVQAQTLFWETELFSDVEGASQKLVSAGWSVEEIDGMLYGHVQLMHLKAFTEAELEDLGEKIEQINSTEFAIRLKQWSVLTDEGLLFIYLCSSDGDYSLITPEEDEEDPCLCPFCQKQMEAQALPETAGSSEARSEAP